MNSTPVQFPVVAVMGPTAVGKTALVLRLAEEINAEIVNVDSIQIYKGLDIGSAKPSKSEMDRIRHHLIDIREPDEPFDAAEFAWSALAAIRKIRSKGKNVILSGGTGLYLNALLQGLAPCSGASPGLRAMLKECLERHGPAFLHEQLSCHDHEAAERLHVNDTFRVIRALEVVLTTGMPLSEWHSLHQERSHTLACIKIALIRPREELYRRINQRVDEMISQGFVKEVEALLKQGYDPQLKPLQSLGYRHIVSFLQGKDSLDEAAQLMKRDTRRYAKRQLTWFRSQKGIQWFNAERLSEYGPVWPRIASRCAALA